jgi:hypothetical protein
MNVFLVAYDMHKPTRHYARIIAELSKGGRRILASDWIVQSPLDAGDLLDHLKQFLDQDDEMIVIEIRAVPRYSDWATLTLAGNPGYALLKRWRA